VCGRALEAATKHGGDIEVERASAIKLEEVNDLYSRLSPDERDDLLPALNRQSAGPRWTLPDPMGKTVRRSVLVGNNL
jgi:hypothetical protein